MCHAQKCLINHVLLSKSAQKFEDMERRKHTSNLIQFFFFNFFQHFHFQVESHYLDPPLFKQTFFVKKTLFFIIFNTAFFLSTPFYSRHVSFFFANFQLPKNICFFKKTNKKLTFSFFFYLLFKIKNHPTSRKRQNEKLYFFCIFSEIEITFFLF